jgi:CDP-paratose 2-epimerase
MKILITGACGFVGRSITEYLIRSYEGVSVWGVDNLMRPDSEFNRNRLPQLGVTFVHGDIRVAKQLCADTAGRSFQLLGEIAVPARPS